MWRHLAVTKTVYGTVPEFPSVCGSFATDVTLRWRETSEEFEKNITPYLGHFALLLKLHQIQGVLNDMIFCVGLRWM
jgi:hypothetical protein